MEPEYVNTRTAKYMGEAELQRKFQDDLNETYPAVMIDGFLYEVGDVLREVNPERFRNKFKYWCRANAWEELYPETNNY